MQPTQTISLLECLSPLRLLGPLSDKELRVASRRVRSYALRSSYIVLLCLLMLSAWYSIVGLPNSSMVALGVSRASVMSTYVAVRILLFEFAAAQLPAALMLSASIGLVLGAGLYFGTRLKTSTLAVAATMVAFLCASYLIGGQYHPLYPLLWRRIVAVIGAWGNSSPAVYAALMTSVGIVVDIVLGLYLLWRARRNVRLYVF